MQTSIIEFSFLLFVSLMGPSSTLIQLRTATKIQGEYTKEQVHQFLATPSNWPKIVLSSWNVEGITTTPLKRNDKVDEFFGLPPLLPLSISWICVDSYAKKGLLDVRSPDGLKGIASDCRMLFQVDQEMANTVSVDLTMEYEPQNLLGTLAIPVLTIDNALALKVLLPNVMKQEMFPKKPLDDFHTKSFENPFMAWQDSLNSQIVYWGVTRNSFTGSLDVPCWPSSPSRREGPRFFTLM